MSHFKQKIKEIKYNKYFNKANHIILFSDLPKDIQENDIISIISEEPYYSENNSHDGYTDLIVFRERDETDDEHQKRIDKLNKFKEDLKNKRYETYLNLKSEFEPNT